MGEMLIGAASQSRGRFRARGDREARAIPDGSVAAGEIVSARVIPWLIFGLVIVPLLVVAFVVTRRRTVAAEHPANETAQDKAQIEQEFAESEAYQAKWREEDKVRHDQERFP